MGLERWLETKVAEKPSPQPPPKVEQRPSHGGVPTSVCESCSYTGTSEQVGSHKRVHENGSRYEIRQVIDPESGSHVLEDAYNGKDRCVLRARVREDQTGFLYQVYDRLEKVVVFG